MVEKKNKALLGQEKENIKEFLESRSCYRQFIRMFVEGKVSPAVSAESKIMIDEIKSANFDIMKLNNRATVIKSIYKDIEEEIEKIKTRGFF